MNDILIWLSQNPAAATTVIVSIGVLTTAIILIYLIAFFDGREISFWPPKIGSKPERETAIIKSPQRISFFQEKQNRKKTRRIALMCSTTLEIEKSPDMARSLKLFYKNLIAEIEKTHYGINYCGAEPLQEILFEHYCAKLRSLNKSQMDEFSQTVRWYWFAGSNVGLNFAPAYFESHETPNVLERTIREATDADIIVAFTGRTGTRREIEKLLQLHNERHPGINLEQKPLIVLGWFGGSAKEFVDENRGNIEWIFRKYPELNPAEKIDGWDKGDTPIILARKLVNTIHRLLNEKNS